LVAETIQNHDEGGVPGKCSETVLRIFNSKKQAKEKSNMKATKTSDRRSEWLAEAKKLTLAAVDRQGALDDTCSRYGRDDGRKKALQRVAKDTEKIRQSCQHLHEIETREDPPMGAAAIGISGTEPLQVAFTLLVMSRLNENLACETSNVARLIEIAAGRDPAEGLTVRSAFRRDSGILRPLVECEVGRTLDELDDVALKESIFNQALELPDDAEADTVSDARSMRLKRRLVV
jgi:hypothetical protein